MKQLDQERKKKKGEEKMQVDSDSTNMSNMQEKDLEIKTDDLVVSYLYDVLIIILVESVLFSLMRRKKAKICSRFDPFMLNIWSFFSAKIKQPGKLA